MVATRFKGRVTSVILQSGNIASSFKAMRWRERSDRVQPETVANTVQPVGWHQGHRWTDVEIRVLGEITEVLGSGTALVSTTGDNLVMDSCAVTFTNHLGSSMIVFVTSPVIDNIETPIEDAVSTETTIRMKAYSVSLPKTA